MMKELGTSTGTGGDRGFAFFFFSSRRRHTRLQGDWSSDVCSSDLRAQARPGLARRRSARQRPCGRAVAPRGSDCQARGTREGHAGAAGRWAGMGPAMNLRELFLGLDVSLPAGDVEIRSLAVDSRKVRPGALFAALP